MFRELWPREILIMVHGVPDPTNVQAAPSVPLPKLRASSAWRQARVKEGTKNRIQIQPHPVGSNLAQMQQALTEYQIEKVLGSGSNGIVYKARSLTEQTIIAIKVQHRSASAHQKARFLREIRAIAGLHHPNIVQIFEAGTCTILDETGERRELSYYTMPYVPGADLGRLLATKSAELNFLVHTLITVARALQFAHWHGFVHRDVKPSNILLDRKGKPYLIDFGFAKKPRTDPHLTDLGTTVGTPAYMAPEQARGRQQLLCPASDIFSLGAILYEMVTGVPPHEKENRLASIRALVKEPAVPLRELVPDTPPELERICLRALRKQISERYASAADFAEELELWMMGQGQDDAPHSKDSAPSAPPPSGGWRKSCSTQTQTGAVRE